MIQKIFLCLVLSSNVYANDILLQRNTRDSVGLAQCFISAHYVGLAVNGEEVDGKSHLVFNSSIPDLATLLEKIEQAKHSDLVTFPFKKSVVENFSGDMAFSAEQFVIALEGHLAGDLIQFIDLNCI
jgi:hypothetical protein